MVLLASHLGVCHHLCIVVKLLNNTECQKRSTPFHIPGNEYVIYAIINSCFRVMVFCCVMLSLFCNVVFCSYFCILDSTLYRFTPFLYLSFPVCGKLIIIIIITTGCRLEIYSCPPLCHTTFTCAYQKL